MRVGRRTPGCAGDDKRVGVDEEEGQGGSCLVTEERGKEDDRRDDVPLKNLIKITKTKKNWVK